MSDSRHEGASGSSQDETRIERLLHLAGPPVTPSEERRARVFSAVQSAWAAETLGRRRRIGRYWVAAACVGMFAAAIAWFVPGRSTDQESMIVAVAAGGGRVVRAGDTIPLRIGQSLRAGDLVSTRDSGASIRIGDSVEFRVGQGTQLELLSPARARLQKGLIYVDSSGEEAVICIETKYGSVADVGTQFEISSSPASMRIRVREGTVELSGEAGPALVGRGEELRVSKAGLERGVVDPRSEEWNWIRAVAAPFELEGRSMADLLRWTSRESGYVVQYETLQVQLKAGTTILHGRMPPLPPMDAAAAISLSTGYSLRRENDLLIVSLRSD